jgi:hypothetical protein
MESRGSKEVYFSHIYGSLYSSLQLGEDQGVEKRSFHSHTYRSLKVPKCEIFDRSDFHDFYPINSLWEGDFRVKIKCLKKNI